VNAAHDEELFRYINLKLAALGLPVNRATADPYFLELAGPLLRNYHQKDQFLGNRLCPADTRIQAFLDSYFAGFELPRPPAPQARLLEMQLATAPGDAALLALWIAADAGAAGPGATERAQIVQALMRGGFAHDARAYALEGLIGLLAAPPAPKPSPPPRAPVRRTRRLEQ